MVTRSQLRRAYRLAKMVLTLSNVSPPYDSQTKDRLAVLKIFPTDEDNTSLQVQQFRNELKLSVKFRQKVRLLPLIWRKK